MDNRMTLRRVLSLILGTAMTCGAGIGYAFDMGNMMNPSKWMGGGNNRDYYDEGPWGGPGYGYGGPGYGYGVPGGYGGPGYGYGVPGGYGGPGYGYGYGYGGPGGYGVPGYGYGGPGGYTGPGYGRGRSGADSAPTGYGSPPTGEEEHSELDALRERIRALEGSGVR